MRITNACSWHADGGPDLAMSNSGVKSFPTSRETHAFLSKVDTHSFSNADTSAKTPRHVKLLPLTQNDSEYEGRLWREERLEIAAMIGT